MPGKRGYTTKFDREITRQRPQTSRPLEWKDLWRQIFLPSDRSLPVSELANLITTLNDIVALVCVMQSDLEWTKWITSNMREMERDAAAGKISMKKVYTATVNNR